MYECIVDERFENGTWKVVTDTKETLKIKRVSEPPHFTSYGMCEDIFTIKKDNYASNKTNKDGSRTVSRHCYKYINDECFILYPDRGGIPFRFNKVEIKDEN